MHNLLAGWRRLLLWSLLAVQAGALGGCSDQCDARSDSGFFDTAGGVLSGCYERNDNRLMSQIRAQQNLNRSLQAMLDSLQQEQQALASRKARQQGELQSLNSSWQALKADLDAKAQSNQALQQQIDALQNSMNDINRTPSMSESEKARKLENLRQQVQVLTEELNSEEFY